MTNTTQTLLFVSFLFLALMVSPVFFLGFEKFYGLLGLMALFVFTCSPQPKPQS